MGSLLITGTMYAVIFATGLTGLIYQVTWQKYLGRLLGSDSIATAIILAAFLGGLSLGYYLCGQMTTRVRNHFRGYALLELLIGLWCFLFPTIFAATESLTRQWSFAPPWLIIAQGLLCCCLLIAIPTMCMGGTIPFLTSGLSRSLGEATRIHAHVYAVNTGGAFVGALLAGFWLIPAFGLPTTMRATALINCLAGLFFLLVATRPGKRAESLPEAEPAPLPGDGCGPGKPHAPAALYLIAFLSGFYVMTLENVLIRVTNLSLGSSSYSFSLIVAAFILSIAIGSSLVGRLRRLWPPQLFVNQLAIAALLLVIFFSLDTWPYYAHLLRVAFQSNLAGFWAYYATAFLALLFLLLAPVALMGATVPITFHEIKRDLALVGRHSGMLFSCNTLGNLTGSLVGGIVLYSLLDNDGVFRVALLCATFSALLATRPLGGGWRVGAATAAALIAAIAFLPSLYDKSRFMIGTFRLPYAVATSFSGPTAFYRSYFEHDRLIFYRDGVANTVAVTGPSDMSGAEPQSRSIIVNGKSDSSTRWDTHTLKLSAHLPALFCRHEAKSAMIVGLGTGVTVGELGLHPGIERLEVAEISPTVIEALPLFGDYTHQVHQDPRLTLHQGDAFRVIGRSQGKWDIIVSEPSNPWVTGVDMLFSDRFYREVQPHLSEGGVFLQWVQIYNTSPVVLGMVMRTISEHFRHVRVFAANAGDLLLLASQHDLDSADILRAEKRLQDNEAVRHSLEAAGIRSLDGLLLREILTPDHLRAAFADSLMQTLDHPRLHYLAGRHFFFGSRIELSLLLSLDTAAHWPAYALAKRHPDWATRCLEEELVREAIHGLTDSATIVPLESIAEAVVLKAMTTANCPAGESFGGKTNEATKAQVRLIAGQGDGEDDWRLAGLGEAALRERVSSLVGVVQRTRNWIVPYPVDGLLQLLEQGATESASDEERSWYLEQRALLDI